MKCPFQIKVNLIHSVNEKEAPHHFISFIYHNQGAKNMHMGATPLHRRCKGVAPHVHILCTYGAPRATHQRGP